MDLQYKMGEDGMLYPQIEVGPEGDIGKYGRMRARFMREHRKREYNHMMFDGNSKEYLMDINRQANEMLDRIMEQMKKKEGVTEELKKNDQMKWVQMVNRIKHEAEQIVIEDLIYS